MDQLTESCTPVCGMIYRPHNVDFLAMRPGNRFEGECTTAARQGAILGREMLVDADRASLGQADGFIHLVAIIDTARRLLDRVYQGALVAGWL